MTEILTFTDLGEWSGKMGFVQSLMNKINGKALLEPFCFRDPPKYLPRALRKTV